MHHTNSNQNRIEVVILILNKLYFGTKNMLLMTKWPIHQEDITIKNKYAHNKTQNT